MAFQNLDIDWEQELIIPALRAFYASPDGGLVGRGLGERNLAAHIYFYMRCLFSRLEIEEEHELSIDSEYDKNYEAQKGCYQKCEGEGEGCPCLDCAASRRKITSLTPDIIIHRRNSNDNNQVAIEIKKEANQRRGERENDASKLSYLTCQLGAANDPNDYKNDYKYKVGYFIDLDKKRFTITKYENHVKGESQVVDCSRAI